MRLFRPGQLWLAVPVAVGHAVAADAGAGAGVVMVVADHAGWVEVLRVTSAPEEATGADVVVDPAAVDVAWPVVANGDLRGCVWPSQLTGRVGSVRWPVRGRRGVPLGGPATDRRWAVKDTLGAAWDRLVADCTATLLTGPGGARPVGM